MNENLSQVLGATTEGGGKLKARNSTSKTDRASMQNGLGLNEDEGKGGWNCGRSKRPQFAGGDPKCRQNSGRVIRFQEELTGEQNNSSRARGEHERSPEKGRYRGELALGGGENQRFNARIDRLRDGNEKEEAKKGGKLWNKDTDLKPSVPHPGVYGRVTTTTAIKAREKKRGEDAHISCQHLNALDWEGKCA